MRKLGLKSNERKKVQELVDYNKSKDKESYSYNYSKDLIFFFTSKA